MDEKRTELLVSIAFKDKETAETLLQKSPADVCEYVNKQGYDFSEDEVIEFGECLKQYAELQSKNEFSAEELEEVAGGKGSHAKEVAIAFATGFALGFAVACCW